MSAAGPALELLTERERECLRLVHAHWNSKQIARQLGIKPGTVDKYCERAARKLKTDGRVSAAILLIGAEPHPNGSQSEPVSLEVYATDGPLEAAKEAADDRTHQWDSIRLLDLRRNHSGRDGDVGGQEVDGPASGRRDAQTGAVPDTGGYPVGSLLPGRGLAGFQLPAVGLGPEHLQRIILVFGIAAVAVLIVTGIAGAERFAFLLQKLRYGG